MPDRDLATLETGLDALELTEAGRVPAWRSVTRSGWPKLAAVAAILAVWELVVIAHVKARYVVPSPADVWTAIAVQVRKGAVQTAVWNSVRRGIAGFALSVVIATPLGLLMARVRVVGLALGSLVSGLQSLPSVAWVPAAVIWFGLTDHAIAFVVIMGAVPSIANGVVAGVERVPPLLRRAGRILGARGLSEQRHVVLPAALPSYVAGLKQGWSFSWRSLMAAELITFSPKLGLGLGQLLDAGRQTSDMPLVLAAIGLILLVGFVIDAVCFAPLDRAIRRRWGLSS